MYKNLSIVFLFIVSINLRAVSDKKIIKSSNITKLLFDRQIRSRSIEKSIIDGKIEQFMVDEKIEEFAKEQLCNPHYTCIKTLSRLAGYMSYMTLDLGDDMLPSDLCTNR